VPEPAIWVGAVAYDPKVVTIWEGMRRYFHEEAHLPVEVVLFQSYDAQVTALLADGPAVVPRIDIAWNTNLAYLQSVEWSAGACRPIAMRDTDLGWTSLMIAPAGGAVSSLAALRGRTLAVGSRDSGHAAILPLYFLEREGLVVDRDFRAIRFDTDVGKHGDTGTSEVDVLRAVLDGRADAGVVGSPFWTGVQQQQIVPACALTVVWSSPPYSHCMFTGRPGLDPEIARRFAGALYGMHVDNPAHRPVLEAEGLKAWLPADTGGYESLTEACRQQGHFRRPM
jgi:phosphonate transport system substrate-binding protein